MSGEVLASAGADIRDNLVTTAVKFLTNPNVQRCTLESKERFLRSKGLTDLEIQKAIEKCGEFMDVPAMTSELMFFHHSRRSWFRENILPLIIYGGFAYGCYWFYKNCIRHLLFVEEPKRKSTGECIEELRKSLDILNSSVSSLRGELQTTVQQNALRTQLDNIKSDIASVKGILLNRNQFPTLKTRSDPPSIPAWQRQSEEATSTEATTDEKKKPHRSRSQRSESGGSNSSEGEQATKNSDSSLEIMDMPSKVDIKEKPKPPKDAYAMWLYSDAAIDELKAAYPGLEYSELIKKGSEVWNTVDQSEWKKKAAIAKEEYTKELEKYIWNNSSKFNTDEKPKRPMSAYMLWLSGARERIKADNVGRKVTEIAQIGGKIWRSMDHSEWEDKAAKAKEKYVKDLEAFIRKHDIDDEE